MPPPSYPFPPDFTWGVAAAAAQIEGAACEDGKSESIWDRFAATSGKVRGGDTPAIACDHYHRFDADFALMRELGVRHYRLSLAWPRLHPDGGTKVNPAGIDFYRRLFDAMRDHGITPWVTLYHWDLPQTLEDAGGWRVSSTAEAFGIYSQTVVRAFHDHVKHWITLNEIPAFVGNGYEQGIHAPGARESGQTLRQIYHHTLLAHAFAVASVREHGGTGAKVGLTQDIRVPIPVTETPADITAAETMLARENAHLLAPIFHGHYPEEFLHACGDNAPIFTPEEMRAIAAPTDFLGLNIYSGKFVQSDADGEAKEIPYPPAYPQAELPWLQFAPQSIYWAMRHCTQLYSPNEYFITENGAGFEDTLDANDECHDLHRREFLRNYLLQVHRAVDEGLPCRGYFAWSIMDNFEWAEGYAKRFGLVHVDFSTQRRTPKLSARWYAQVMRENRLL